MRLTIAAVGRLKAGPERDLTARYLDRLAKSGPAVALEWGGVSELPEARSPNAAERKRDEAARLSAALPDKAALVVLDETGRSETSEAFAERLAQWRDEGVRDTAFVIGGPDGLDHQFRAGARAVLALGAMTWPHQIVRLLLAEQLYRASTILSGHPYHRS